MAKLHGLASVLRLFWRSRTPERRRSVNRSMPKHLVPCEQRILLSGVAAADDAASVPHGYLVNMNVGTNDTTPGHVKQFEIVTQGTKGTASFTDPATGAFTYSTYLQNGFVDTDTVIYKVKCYQYDSNWNLNFIGEDTGSIVITGTNAAPNAVDDTGYSAQMYYSDIDGTNEYDTIKVTFTAAELLLNDTDTDPLENLKIVGGSPSATLLYGDPSNPSKVTGIEFEIAGGNTGLQTLTYTVSDAYGATDSASIFVNVAAVKDPWQIAKGPAAVQGGTTVKLTGKGTPGGKAQLKFYEYTGNQISGQNTFKQGTFISDIEVDVDANGDWEYNWPVPAATSPVKKYFFQLQNGIRINGTNTDNRFRKETRPIQVNP